jgi:RsiW-degrading membrane proteinase PrsW (M82 family)
MLTLISLYYLIGLLFCSYTTYYYRLSKTTKTEPKSTDAIMALWGVWIWPLLVFKHVKDRNTKKS